MTCLAKTKHSINHYCHHVTNKIHNIKTHDNTCLKQTLRRKTKDLVVELFVDLLLKRSVRVIIVTIQIEIEIILEV